MGVPVTFPFLSIINHCTTIYLRISRRFCQLISPATVITYLVDKSNMEDNHTQSSATRRRRPALSCTICRRRKLKCDRSLPCGQCVKSKTPDLCVFSAPRPSQSAASGSTMASSPSDHRHAPSDGASSGGSGLYVFDSRNRVTKPRGRPDELHELRNRVQVLEQALARGGSMQPPEVSGYDYAPEFPIRTVADAISDQVMNLSGRACFRGRNGRTRYRGRSTGELTITFVRKFQ